MKNNPCKYIRPKYIFGKHILEKYFAENIRENVFPKQKIQRKKYFTKKIRHSKSSWWLHRTISRKCIHTIYTILFFSPRIRNFSQQLTQKMPGNRSLHTIHKQFNVYFCYQENLFNIFHNVT